MGGHTFRPWGMPTADDSRLTWKEEGFEPAVRLVVKLRS